MTYDLATEAYRQQQQEIQTHSLEQRTQEMTNEAIKNSTYTAYKLEADGSLVNETKLTDSWEVNYWLETNKFNYIVIIQDITGKAKRGFRLEGYVYDWSKYVI